MKLKQYLVIALILSTGLVASIIAQEPYDGLTFYSRSSSAYLYDMDKKLIHSWKSSFSSAATAHLLRDSSVLYSGRDLNGWRGGVLNGGRIQIIKWNGDLAWDFQYSSADHNPHHNMEVMYYTDDPKEVPNVMVACYIKESGTSYLIDKLVEIKPTGKRTGEVVWEWNAWDHRTDDPDNHPELLESPNSSGYKRDWTHVNNISYNRRLDQLIVDLKSFHEFIIIDHSTTIEEAAGSTGGKYGKGGDVLYRWGKASNYGISGSDYLSGFHGGIWVDRVCPRTFEELPGADNIMLFHNDKGELVELTPPGNGDGVYPRDPGKAFGPKEPVWTESKTLARHEGSVQKLPNGNILVGDPSYGIYEITEDGDKIWSLTTAKCNQARRYSYAYLDQSVGIKKLAVSSNKEFNFNINYNRLSGNVKIALSHSISQGQLNIFKSNGKKIYTHNLNKNYFNWSVKNLPSGIYIMNMKSGNKSISKFFNLVR